MRGRGESRLCLCIEEGDEEVGLREGVGAVDGGNWEKGVVFCINMGADRRWYLISFFGKVFRHWDSFCGSKSIHVFIIYPPEFLQVI